MAEVTLGAAIRSNLLSLQITDRLIGRTQGRLSTGLEIASPIDGAKKFFEAKGLTDRASDFDDKKDGIDQAISNVKVALDAVNGIDELVTQLKGLAISAKSATGTELTSIVTQYNTLITQIDNLARDAEFQGLNLVNGSGSVLKVEFGKSSLSILNINSVDLRSDSTGLDLTSAGGPGTLGGHQFTVSSLASAAIDAAIAELDAAATTLRSNASTLGSNVGLLQTRLDFTNKYVNDLTEGAGKLTLADINEEGANLVALQTRQQLGITALAFAGQSEASVLSLFL